MEIKVTNAGVGAGDKKFLETSDIFRALIPHFYANVKKKKTTLYTVMLFYDVF